jgi:hypothetical protein
MFTEDQSKEINFTDLTPVRKFEHEIDSKGLAHILVPKYTDPILGRFLQPRLRDKYIKADLDEIGTALWLFIDGKIKVHDLVWKMKDKFGEQIDPAYERVTLFLQQLHKNKFIYFKEFKKD